MGVDCLKETTSLCMKLGRVAKADLRRVERAAGQVEEARAELYAAVRAAYASGETLRDIASAAKMSHQGIHRIVTRSQ